FELLAKRPCPEAAGITGVTVDHLLIELLPRYVDLLGVDDNDEIAGVHMWRVLRLVLAAELVGDARRQPPDGLTLGVHHVPVALNLSGLRGVGLHLKERRRPGDRRRSSLAAR